MDALQSYLTTAMLASVASALCIQLTDERFRKYVKFVAGLCLTALLALPLTSLVSELSEVDLSFEQSESATLTGDSAYIELLGSELSRSIGDRVALLYDLPRESVYVTLSLDTADLSAIAIVSIDILVTTECDEKAIERALEDEFACAVEVRKELADETDR